jgi:polyferredoxin
LESIEAGAKLASGRSKPDAVDRLTERKQRAEIGTIEQGNRDRRANRVLRFRYAKAVYRYLAWYSSFSLILLILSGFKPWGFSLPENVLSLIVGSTAVAAIGLVGFVVQGLFKAPT